MTTHNETTIEAVKQAIRTEPAFIAACAFGVPSYALDQCADLMARAALAAIPEAPCDGGCSYESGPDETCTAHGRPVAEVWEIVNDIARQRDEALAATPEPATVGGVTLEQIALECYKFHATDYSDLHSTEAMSLARLEGRRILALFPPAPSTVDRRQFEGTWTHDHSGERPCPAGCGTAPSTVGTARRAKAYLELVDDRYLVMLGTGSDEDYCVSEFLKHEKYDAEVTAQVINEALEDARTPATTRDVGADPFTADCGRCASLAADQLPERDPLDTDHAVALERERIAAWITDNLYCPNCDGRLCMGCVFREYDHVCAENCPDCCKDGQEIPAGTRYAQAIRSGEHWRAQ